MKSYSKSQLSQYHSTTNSRIVNSTQLTSSSFDKESRRKAQLIKEDFEKFYRSNMPGCMSSATLEKTISNGGYINPTILEERELNVTSLDVFSRLMMDRILFFETEVNDTTAMVMKAQLLYMENVNPNEKVTMYINSPGGGVYSGYGIIDTMNLLDCDVATVNTGVCASMGAMLLMSGEPGQRYSLTHASTMIHQPLGGASGQCSDIQIEAAEILRLKDLLYETISKCTNQPVEKVELDANRDNWMSPSEALEYGIIDCVLEKLPKAIR